MPDWKVSMQRTYEFYEVNPQTWKNTVKLTEITKCSLDWDLDTDTLTSATLECTCDLKECYVRVYMITIQNRIKEKHPLGTYLIQTPGDAFNGKHHSISIDAYSPLIELKESRPPIGFTIMKGENIMESAVQICKEHMRAPIIAPTGVKDKIEYDFVAETDDTWFSFVSDLISNANYRFMLDEMGRVLFAPEQDTASLQPVEVYEDTDISILYPDLDVERDLYGIPNVVEVVHSSDSGVVYSRVVNDDVNSPISTVNRGREILYRDTNPSVSGTVTQEIIDDYAEKLLREQSTLEYKITYKHGYTRARIGECVRINYVRAGLKNVQVKIISQSFTCDSECAVSETAIYTNKLWGK